MSYFCHYYFFNSLYFDMAIIPRKHFDDLTSRNLHFMWVFRNVLGNVLQEKLISFTQFLFY